MTTCVCVILIVLVNSVVCCSFISTTMRPRTEEKCAEFQSLMCKNGEYTISSDLSHPGSVTTGRTESTTHKFSPHFVTGGRRAHAKSHPYMALIGYGDEHAITWECGGSLISESFVLSAAHCANTSYGLAGWVRLGDLDLNSVTDDAKPQQFRIKERLVHSGYSAPAYYNDIVLFKLATRVVFNDYIGPVCLHNSVGDLEGQGVVAGWGKNESHGPRSSSLQEASIKFVSAEECKLLVGVIRNYLSSGLNTQTMVCAGEPGKDTCQGDSGGPLVLEPAGGTCLATLVGVTSFGPRYCGMTDIPGVYVRVAHFLPWIESVVWPTS